MQELNSTHVFSHDISNAQPAEVRTAKGAVSTLLMGLVQPLDASFKTEKDMSKNYFFPAFQQNSFA